MHGDRLSGDRTRGLRPSRSSTLVTYIDLGAPSSQVAPARPRLLKLRLARAPTAKQRPHLSPTVIQRGFRATAVHASFPDRLEPPNPIA